MNQQRLIQFMDRLIRTSSRKVFLILDSSFIVFLIYTFFEI